MLFKPAPYRWAQWSRGVAALIVVIALLPLFVAIRSVWAQPRCATT